MPVLRHIYDPASGIHHDVEVTKEVYNYYRRSSWAIRRNNARFYANEVQFSNLIGGLNDAFENFKEFRSLAGDPQKLLCDAETCRMIAEAFQKLSPADQRILRLLIIEEHSERWYAGRTGIPQKTVHYRKRIALKKLHRQIRQTEKAGVIL